MKRTKTLSEADLNFTLTGLPDEGESLEIGNLGIDIEMPEDEEGEEDEAGDDLDLGDDEEGGDEEGEEGGDELDLDLGDEDSDEEEQEESQMETRRLSDNVIVEIDEGMLRREISRMRALREEDETKAQSWGNGPGDVSDDFEDDDLGDPFIDIDLTTEGDDKEDKDDENSGGLAELDLEGDDKEDGEDPEGQDNKPGPAQAQMESFRRRLRAEARIQAEAKQQAQKMKQGAKQQKADSDKKMKEAQQAKKQGKQQTAAQKTKESKQADQKGKKMKEAYEFYARKFNESVTRSNRLRGLLAEASARQSRVLNGAASRSAAETFNLRTKLAETNLFNAKLLFTNKLLQNEALTKRQKASIIERLDEARSEREVKLVYESLTKTLQASSTKLNETAERGVIGSSSRAARPAAASNATSTLNEGYEADRWARLAGIVK